MSAVRAIVAVVVASIMALGAPSGASASEVEPTESRGETHCVSRLADLIEERQRVKCFPTETEALAFMGLPQLASFSELDAMERGELEQIRLVADVPLARFYETYNATGSSHTIVGSNCAGGGLSLLGSTWNNRIRSVQHHLCYRVRYWQTTNYTGSSQDTTAPYLGTRTLDAPWSANVSSMRFYGPLN